MDDWDDVDVGPEVVALALVSARFKLQHKQGLKYLLMEV